MRLKGSGVTMITIRPAKPNEPTVRALIEFHLSGMISNSPKDSVYALDASGLSAPDVTLFGAFEDEVCISIGALKKLDSTIGEIKSMRTTEAALGRGIGKSVLEHIIQTARETGLKKLVLETGTGESFDAAHHVYKNYGFRPCGVFGDYNKTEFNRFFSLTL